MIFQNKQKPVIKNRKAYILLNQRFFKTKKQISGTMGLDFPLSLEISLSALGFQKYRFDLKIFGYPPSYLNL